MRKKAEFIGIRGKVCDIVELESSSDWFYYRKDEKEEELPKVGAWCRNCAKETAKPVYPVYMNCKPAYALRCPKCGGEYAMYKGMFMQRYVGTTLKNGGRINPTHGLMSHTAAMDRRAREHYNNIPKKVEDQMCEKFGCSHEEYAQMQKKWDAENQRIHKVIERERADMRARLEEDERVRESANRKALIEQGVLKYVKNIGLVNTETGEVVKL